jgi:hypothetical protein
MALRIGLKFRTHSINARAGTSFWLIVHEWSGYQLAIEFFPQYICRSIYCSRMLGTVSIGSQSAGISMRFGVLPTMNFFIYMLFLGTGLILGSV